MEVAAGAFHLKRHLSPARQRALVDACRTLVDGEVPDTSVVRGGGKMHVAHAVPRPRHWNGNDATATETRRSSDYDQLRVPPLPAEFQDLARGIAAVGRHDARRQICVSSTTTNPDGPHGACIRTRTRVRDRLPPALPVVSVVAGDTARFPIWRTARAAIIGKRCFSSQGDASYALQAVRREAALSRRCRADSAGEVLTALEKTGSRRPMQSGRSANAVCDTGQRRTQRVRIRKALEESRSGNPEGLEGTDRHRHSGDARLAAGCR